MLKLFILCSGWARALLTRLLTLTQSLFNTSKYNRFSCWAYWASRAFCPLGLGVETARGLSIVSQSSRPGLLSLSLSWARDCSSSWLKLKGWSESDHTRVFLSHLIWKKVHLCTYVDQWTDRPLSWWLTIVSLLPSFCLLLTCLWILNAALVR